MDVITILNYVLNFLIFQDQNGLQQQQYQRMQGNNAMTKQNITV